MRAILGIETSCDETAASVVGEDFVVRSSVVVSSIDLHVRFGGVVPELAGRAQVDAIAPVVEDALRDAGLDPRRPAIDAVAVTRGPGLVGSLLVGMSAAKAMAYAWGVPLVGVNHLEGHLVASRLEHPDLPLPVVTLLVSGGHTMLVAERAVGQYELLGSTIDDAVGEAYDKVARYLGLGYPGGPVIDRLSTEGDPGAFDFHAPCATSGSTSACRVSRPRSSARRTQPRRRGPPTCGELPGRRGGRPPREVRACRRGRRRPDARNRRRRRRQP